MILWRKVSNIIYAVSILLHHYYQWFVKFSRSFHRSKFNLSTKINSIVPFSIILIRKRKNSFYQASILRKKEYINKPERKNENDPQFLPKYGCHLCLWMPVNTYPPSVTAIGKNESIPLSSIKYYRYCYTTIIGDWWIQSFHCNKFNLSTKINSIFPLSLIHIWRCRRSTLCRSRWSPYH